MLRIALLFALAIATLGSHLFDPHFNDLWEKYKSLNNKDYHPKEEGIRRLIWEKAVRKIMKHNIEADLGLHTYTLGINQFSDMTDEEFCASRNGFFNSTTKETFVMSFFPDISLPDEIDWRKKGLVTPVKDQGECDSSWAFSATGSLEGLHKKNTGNLVSLSEQNLIDCSRDYGTAGCLGGNVDSAFLYITNNGGIDTEDSYPYEAKDGKCRFSKSNVGATMSEIGSLFPHNEQQLQGAVVLFGPISVTIDACGSNFRHYRGGIYIDRKCSSTKLNHAALVVGYGTENGRDYWLVKNSWGTKWGEEGYIKMARNRKNMCGIATHAIFAH